MAIMLMPSVMTILAWMMMVNLELLLVLTIVPDVPDREVAMCEGKLGIASARAGVRVGRVSPHGSASRPAILMSSREQFRTCGRAEGCVDTP